MLKKVLLLIFVLHSLTSVVCFSQTTIFDKPYSLRVSNQPLSSVLELLEKKCGRTFSYNNSIVDGTKLVSIDVENMALADLLQNILGNDYRWVVYKNQVLISLRENSRNKSLTQTKSTRKTFIDTVKITIRDTIRHNVYDTVKITKRDTIVFVDTVLLSISEKQALPKHYFNVMIYGSPISKTFTQFILSDESQMFSGFIKQSEKDYKTSDYGLLIDYERQNIRYRAGIGCLTTTKNIQYDFEKQYTEENQFFKDSIPYWKYKTIVYYYKFKDGDTVKIPIIDSVKTYYPFSYVKHYIERTRIRANNTIKTVYLPLSIGYSFYISKNAIISPYFSSKLFYVFSHTGYTFDTKDLTAQEITAESIKLLSVSTAISAQIERKINTNSRIYIEPSFNYFVTKTYKNKNNINERISQFQLFFGIRSLLFVSQ